jgi:hypothetical protein
MQTECKQNAKMLAKCNKNSNKMQANCKQNANKTQVKLNKNAISKLTLRSVCMMIFHKSPNILTMSLKPGSHSLAFIITFVNNYCLFHL